MDLLEGAQSHGFDIKVIFIGTEHPDLNIARILSRVSRSGLFAPVATLHEDYGNGLRQLKRLARAADELVLLDNTVEGRSARVVAQFVGGKIVKLARSVPAWAQEVFGREFSEWLAPKDQVKERGR
jgi:predicted ABC-type ATPase